MCHQSASTLSDIGSPDSMQAISGAWYRALVRIDPGLASEEVRSQVDDATEALIARLVGSASDPEGLVQAGSEMDALDVLQPRDVPSVQDSILRAFGDVLSGDLWAAHQARLTQALFDLAAGLNIGRSRRAERFNIAITSRMAHDLKTPINAITGFSKVILKGIDGPITDFQREDLTSIYEAGQRLLVMVDDLFAVRKQDAARSLALDRPFRVVDLLGEIVRTAQPLAAERDHALVVRMVDDLGEMDQDPSRVRWALLCLLSHMIRRPGGGQITLTVERDYREGSWVAFGVIKNCAASVGSTVWVMLGVDVGGGSTIGRFPPNKVTRFP